MCDLQAWGAESWAHVKGACDAGAYEEDERLWLGGVRCRGMEGRHGWGWAARLTWVDASMKSVAVVRSGMAEECEIYLL